MVGIDVAGTLARLAIIAVNFGVSVETGNAGLATSAIITGKTVAAYFISFLVHLATGGEIVGWEGQWTGTNQTIGRSSSGSVAVVALLTEFAMVTRRAVFAVLR